MSGIEVAASVFLDGIDTSDDVVAICGLVDDLFTNRRSLDATADPATITAARRTLVEHDVWGLLADEANGNEVQRLMLVLAAVERLARVWPALALSLLQSSTAASLLDRLGATPDLVSEVVEGRPVALVNVMSRGVALQWSDDGSELTAEKPGVGVQGQVLRLDPCGDAAVVLVDAARGRVAVVTDTAKWNVTPRRTTGLTGAATTTVEVSCSPEQIQLVPVPAHEAERLMVVQNVGLAVIACAVASTAAEATARYVGERVQFGRVLAQFPAVRDARDRAEVALARAVLVVRECVRQLGDPRARVARIEWSLPSVFADCLFVGDTAVQLHGGYGYLEEYGVERCLRDIVSLRAKFDAGDVSKRDGRNTDHRTMKETSER